MIKRARLKRGYEAKRVARRLHISASCLSRYESGERHIPCEMVPEIARCLGCPGLLEARLNECPVMAAMREERKKAA